MLMPGRSYSIANTNYRYGFNGKEKDNGISSLTDYDYGFRIYNPAIGKFLSVDPLDREYPFYSPYQFASNSPIVKIDIDGLEGGLPKVIGKTYAKLIHLRSDQIEENIQSLKGIGLSQKYLKKLLGAEELSLTMYDVDRAVSQLNTAAGRGGNTTIGFGHLVHYGAIGSTQYDKDALIKEGQYQNGQITVPEAFSILSGDLRERMDILNREKRSNKITDVDQDVTDLFMDLIFNTGNAIKAMRIYKTRGVFGLDLGLRLNNGDKGAIKSVNNERKNMRLDLIKNALESENLRRSIDDPREASKNKKTENIAFKLIRLTNGHILLLEFKTKLFEIIKIYLLT